MNLPKNCCAPTLSTIVVSITYFYDLKKNHIINFGSSELGHHEICANIHAEEIAITKIHSYLKYKRHKKSYNKNIIIYIWKNNAEKKIFPAFTCAWCAGFIKKHNFPQENVITFNSQPAYKENYKQPLKKQHTNY